MNKNRKVTFSDISGVLSAADGYKGIHSQMLKCPEQFFIVEFENGGVTEDERRDMSDNRNDT